MNRFTLRGSDELDKMISRDLQFIVDSLNSLPEKNLWDAIILLGGYGRGEGTPLIKEGKQLPYNDYDIIVVSHQLSKLRRYFTQKRLNELEKTFSVFVQIPVDLYLHTIESLQAAEPSLMNYEFRHGHRVLFGPKDIVEHWMPNFRVKDIPLIEGTRLLMNRGTLLFYDKLNYEKENYLKYLLKTHLAMGDSLLLALGKYEISYLKKREIIQELDSEFDWIKKYYLKAIDFKEWGDSSPWDSVDLDQLLQDTIDHFIPYFFWFEERRLKRKLPSVLEYMKALEETTPPTAKATALNLLYFRQHAFKPNLKWLSIHPRIRLFPALVLLLQDENEELLKKLLPGTDPVKQFIQLRKRFA